MIVKPRKKSATKSPLVNSYPFYSPRFWNGLRAGDYLRRLGKHRFRIHPIRFVMTGLIFCCTVINTVLASLQHLIYARKIAETKLVKPPIFVVGHWRSGTTYLHEILCQDKRLAFSSTYDCFVPHHFLVSRWCLGPLMRWLVPPQRPMDNMKAGAGFPQEDEFALCSLNAPTPYWRIAFCNDPPPYVDLLNFDKSDPKVVEEVRQTFTKFYKTLTLRDQKQLILKSPPHTGRIETLAKWYPGAKFIHISRHPHQVIPSTVRLWKSLDYVQSFQIPKYSEEELLDYVFECFDVMYEGYCRAAESMDPNQLIEVKYEDLVSQPLSVVESIYSQLELNDFEECRTAVTELLAGRRDYQANTKEIDTELRDLIDNHCSQYMDRFGYRVSELAKL